MRKLLNNFDVLKDKFSNNAEDCPDDDDDETLDVVDAIDKPHGSRSIFDDVDA